MPGGGGAEGIAVGVGVAVAVGVGVAVAVAVAVGVEGRAAVDTGAGTSLRHPPARIKSTAIATK
jgi:hypothetical protein